MDTVITEYNMDLHVINKYNFKIIASGAHTDSNAQTSAKEFTASSILVKDDQVTEKVQEITEPVQAPVLADAEPISKSSKDELIESLLKKTDDMSSNFIKMQMKLEEKDEEYKKALEDEKAKAFEEGKQAGIKEAQDLVQAEHEELKKQFSASIQTLDTSTKEFSTSIEGIKEELIHAAVDISKEVILVETSERGNEIANILAKDLISEIQGSAEVTIKVNPNDKLSLEQSLGSLENIKIVADNAIANGGVVVVSDAGNIDGDIMKRYERVKNAALGK